MPEISEEIRKSQREFLHGPEFSEMLKNIVTDAVAEGVSRATEAALARIAALEDELADAKAKLATAERRIEDLDNYNRKNALVISGVPETPDEAVDSLVVDVGRAAGVEIPADSIDDAYRLGRQQQGKTRPIMARFINSGPRHKLLEKRKELSAGNVRDHATLTRSAIGKIFIAESLTPKSQHLLFVARQLKKQKMLWAAYSTNGRINIKKREGDAAAVVSDLADVEEIAGAGALRQFHPRGTTAAGAVRRADDLTWQAADAVNAWVTERRRGRSPRSRPHGTEGRRT